MVVAGALLFALLLLIVAALLWQESRRGTFRNPPTYVLEEAVPYVHARLADRLRGRLGEDDVRRILEWGIAYLQRTPEAVAGGEAVVGHVVDRVREVQGVEYEEEDVRAVLEAETAYWAAIGALGDPVPFSWEGPGGGRHLPEREARP